MTETLEPVADVADQQRVAQQLLAQAREQGVDPVVGLADQAEL